MQGRQMNTQNKCLFQEGQSAAPSMIEVVRYNQPVIRSQADCPGQQYYARDSCWSLLLEGWTLSSGCEWKATLLSPCISLYPQHHAHSAHELGKEVDC